MNGFKCGSIFLLLLSYYTLTHGNNCLLPLKPHERCACCKTGYRGDDCTTPCPNCHRIHYGNRCVDECSIGYHGISCDTSCSVNCIWGNSDTPKCEKDNGACSYGCKPGYYGQQCENECNTACRNNECSRNDGFCYRCNNLRYHGNYCNETCSSGCYNRTCEVNGTCINGCETGLYGADCSMKCGNNCKTHHCTGSRADGFYCVDGCKDGYTLKNCTRKCPQNCQECDQHTSQCSSCRHGFTTHCDNEDCSKGTMLCKEQESPNSEKWLVPLLIAVIVTMTVIVIVIVITVILRRRSNTRQDTSNAISQQNGQEMETDPLLNHEPDTSKVRYRQNRHDSEKSNHDMAQDSLLHKACHDDNLEAVKFLLQNENQDVNSRGKRGMTPVMKAVGKGQGAVKKFLIRQKCDLSLANDDKNTVLHIACRRNDVDFVKYLLERRIFDMNSKGFAGRTPVMMAARYGCTDIFELLRREGCDLHMNDENKDSILHIACYSNNADFVKYLLELDVFNINAKGYREYTPVLLAAYEGYTGVFYQLKNHNCNLHAVDEFGDNVLNTACNSDTNSEFVKYLLTLNIYEINKRGRKGRTPVMTAAKNGCRQLFEILKEAGCNLEGRDTDGDTVLALACRTDNVEFVEYLLSLNIYDINHRASKNRTPVMIAFSKGHKKVSRLLIDKECECQ